MCYRPHTQKCKGMAPAFNELTAKIQRYTTTMVRLTWVWLKYNGVSDEGMVEKAAEIRDEVKKGDPLG